MLLGKQKYEVESEILKSEEVSCNVASPDEDLRERECRRSGKRGEHATV